MFVILTQNQALVNASNFSSISIEKCQNDEIARCIVIDGTYTLGVYRDLNEAIMVVDWLSDTIGNAETSENLTIKMPVRIEKNEKKN
jgi:hypothetical protein